MQLTLAETNKNVSASLKKRSVFLFLFGFFLALLVLNSHAMAILFPIAILFGLGLIVYPELAYLAIVMSIPVALEITGGLTVTTTLMPLAFLSLVLNASIYRCRWPVSIASSEEIFALLFFFSLVLSSLLADNAMLAIKESIQTGVFFIIFFTTASYIRDEDSLKRVLWALIIMGIVEALITVAQVKVGFTLPGKWRLTNMEDIDLSDEFRADGTTPHPITLAHFLQFTIVVAVAGLFWSRIGLIKYLLFFGVILMMLAWYYAFSRTSFIAMAITMIAYLFIRGRIWRWLFACAALVILFLVFFLKINSIGEFIGLIEGLNFFSSSISKLNINSGQDSYGFRIEQFYAVWQLFLDNPLFGVGYEQTNPLYLPYLPSWAVNYIHPQTIHNFFFKVLGEQGILGIMAFTALWYAALKSIRKAWFDEQYGRYARLVLLVLIGQLVMGGMNPIMREIWLSLGMAAAIGKLVRWKNSIST
jgi:O-antigen ligase